VLAWYYTSQHVSQGKRPHSIAAARLAGQSA
jgi:hypothetical protein